MHVLFWEGNRLGRVVRGTFFFFNIEDTNLKKEWNYERVIERIVGILFVTAEMNNAISLGEKNWSNEIFTFVNEMSVIFNEIREFDGIRRLKLKKIETNERYNR